MSCKKTKIGADWKEKTHAYEMSHLFLQSIIKIETKIRKSIYVYIAKIQD